MYPYRQAERGEGFVCQGLLITMLTFPQRGVLSQSHQGFSNAFFYGFILTFNFITTH